MIANKTELRSRSFLWVGIIALVYATAWIAYYGGTSLGESPALDNRQTLELAHAMAEDSLPPEPFHRAPLYPFVLSLFLSAGMPYEMLPLAARALNALSLAFIAASSSLIALRLWRRTSCGWVAGLLVALNPVMLFFVGDAFDILLAIVPLIAAIILLQNWLRQPSLRLSLMIGLLLALGGALRSHILPLAFIWPVAATCLTNQRRLAQGVLAALPVLISLLLLGFSNLQVSGDFRLMPWQGSYNLWAGNAPDASGRIYSQRIRVEFGNSYDNPAKLESIALYGQETGEEPPHSIDAMNHYWRTKTFNQIADQPFNWLGLMFRKAYYFLNSYEQYDNKTYGFHKSRHFLLRWNPIHWGLLLVLAVAGTLIGLRNRTMRPLIIAFIAIFAIYAAGTILFYTSNRFRLPMIPILSVLSAGIVLLPAAWSDAHKTWRVFLSACIFIAAGITYSGLFQARETDTWEEDYAVLANAALRTGRDEAAIRNAHEALAMNPHRADMYAVLAQASFNQWALQEPPREINKVQAQAFLKLCRQGVKEEKHLAAISGIYQWKLGNYNEAVEIWQDKSATDALARICLIQTGYSSPPKNNELHRYRGHPSFALLLAFVDMQNHSANNHSKAVEFINSLLSPVTTALENGPSDKT